MNCYDFQDMECHLSSPLLVQKLWIKANDGVRKVQIMQCFPTDKGYVSYSCFSVIPGDLYSVQFYCVWHTFILKFNPFLSGFLKLKCKVLENSEITNVFYYPSNLPKPIRS